ncbi:MAG: UvrD-helicase domain-containing protein [Candidatus Obscuribacterales bacterium]
MLTEQQQQAVDLVDRNVLVSAGAGSGKTHVLVERYVEILRRYPDCTLANIIAVTFTRKAAAEMRSRLKARFLALSQEELDGRWLDCLAEVDGARIGTIHSLCESILKSHPADCGIDPQFEVLDELTQNELLQDSIDQALKVVIELYGASVSPGDGCEHDVLQEFSIDEIKRILNRLLKGSMQFKQSMKAFDSLSIAGMRSTAERVLLDMQNSALSGLASNREFNSAFDYVRMNSMADAANKLNGVRDILLDHCEQLFAVDSVDKRWQAFMSVSTLAIGNIGGTKPDAKDLRKALMNCRDQAKIIVGKIPATLNQEDERGFALTLGIIQLFERTLTIYEAHKRELTTVDYNDLISLACACLEKDNSQSRGYFNDKLQALLVDEFQDTNDMQATLLSLLAGAGTRVFLIGDDKQSIYKFQGADVATFNKWKSLFKNETSTLSGSSLVTKLTRSFRSHPEVVFFVNSVFNHLLDADPEVVPYVAAFEALEPARQADSTIVAAAEQSDTAVEVMMLDCDIEEDARGLTPALYEAHQVGRWLKKKVEGGYQIAAKSGGVRPITYGDCAVLVVRNGDFASFESMFAQLNIPYVTFGGSGFLRRQEVADFENLFRFLDNPKDSHSLLAVLRSPFCSITDDLLHRVVTEQADHPSYVGQPLWTVIANVVRAREPGVEALSLAVRQLRNLMEYAALLPLGELVQKIIDDTHYDLAMLAAPDGKQRSRNVWKMAHLAAEHEHLSCGEFARRLSLMREFGMRESEAPLDSADAVKLMTVHASKGLEFPVVALPCLGGQLLRNADRLVYHSSYGVAFNSTRLDDQDKPAWYQVASHLDRQMEREEKKRLLYVAMTRARDNLGIFLSAPFRKNESYRQWLMQVLGLDKDDAVRPGPDDRIGLTITSRSDGEVAPYTFSLAVGMETVEAIDAPEMLDQGLMDSQPQSHVLQPVGDASVLQSLFSLEQSLSTGEDLKINEQGRSRVTPRNGTPTQGVVTAAGLGTFFHSLMENLPPSGRKVDRPWIADIAFTQGAMVAHSDLLNRLVDEGERLLGVYYESRLYSLLSQSQQRRHELPYLIDVASSFSELGPDIRPRRPDLIFQDAEGNWHLVDYKTDHFAPKDVEIQARKHREQIKTYVADLRKLTGVELTPWLYFAQHGIFFPV